MMAAFFLGGEQHDPDLAIVTLNFPAELLCS